MAITYIKIATVDVGAGGSTSIVFNSIPQTYTDLCLISSLRISSAPAGTTGIARCRLRINSTTTGYNNKLVYGLSSSAASASSADYITYFYANASDSTSNTFSNSSIYIPNYTTSSNKSISSDSVTESNSNTQGIAALNAGVLSNAAAITSLTIDQAEGGTFVQYSNATLYGISKS